MREFPVPLAPSALAADLLGGLGKDLGWALTAVPPGCCTAVVYMGKLSRVQAPLEGDENPGSAHSSFPLPFP